MKVTNPADAKTGTRAYSVTIAPASMSCSFVGGVSSGAISFGTSINPIDPTAAGPVTGTVNTGVQFTCTLNNPYTVSVNPSSGWTLNTIPYTLGVVSSGTYGGTAVDVFNTGSLMTQSQYGNAPAGTYSNASEITVQISYTGTGSPITAKLPIGSVTGTVINACSITGSPGLIFGTLDAITNALGATATVTPPSIMCTMSDAVTVTNDGGLNYSGTPRLKSGSNYINYNFSSASSLSGAGGTTDIGGNLAMNATIPAKALDNAPAGTSYTDTITLTINY